MAITLKAIVSQWKRRKGSLEQLSLMNKVSVSKIEDAIRREMRANHA